MLGSAYGGGAGGRYGGGVIGGGHMGGVHGGLVIRVRNGYRLKDDVAKTAPRVALADPKVLLKVDDTACARVVACGARRERKATVVQSEGIWDPFTEFEDSRERALL